MNCKNDCGATVWWAAARGQWLHYETNQAVCEFPKKDPRRVLTTLTATPADDVHPATVALPKVPTPPVPR